ncbi:MAG TPA: hypothetical protein DHW15_05375 [Bacteroidetes bacterium]|nr:hypothetical protein [Bacteroidota bacterium]
MRTGIENERQRKPIPQRRSSSPFFIALTVAASRPRATDTAQFSKHVAAMRGGIQRKAGRP